MKLVSLASLTSLVLLGVAGCAGETSSPEASSTQDMTTGISASDIDAAAKLADVSLWTPDPKLSADAVAQEVSSGEFDGTRSVTTLVKDSDGRLFYVYEVKSASDPTARPTHGAPPNFADTRYFLLLNSEGVKWATASYDTVGSQRHAQILTTREDPNFPNDVTDIGNTPAGQTILHFNSALFLVAPGGLDNRCKSESEDCSSLWQRVKASPGADPFDAP